jgi:futalosine hydrolase
MNLLIAAATEAELAPLLAHLDSYRVDGPEKSYKKHAGIRVCITGAGAVATAYHLAKSLSSGPFDLAVQAGIAGSFTGMPAGSLWRVAADRFADLGAEDGDGFHDLFDLGLVADGFPWQERSLPAPPPSVPLLAELPAAGAITVNTVSGRKSTIQLRRERYHPELESMEGAAFHYVCLMEKVNFAQVRSVSNEVEVRDKSRWHIALAVRQLNDFLIRLTDTL